MQQIFTDIYEKKLWGDNKNEHYNGSSGGGSAIEYNKDTYIPFLRNLISDNNIRSIVDLGCGDFRCGPMIYEDLIVKYTGYDAYNRVVEYNNNVNNKQKYSFITLDFFNKKEDIISSDLCILKDVIQHWNIKKIYEFLDYLVMSNKFKYILIINCCGQYRDISQNDNNDIKDGDFRPLSSKFYPLKKYGAIELYKYDTKECSIIISDSISEIREINNNEHKEHKEHHFLTYEVELGKKIRLGNKYDGGYVIYEPYRDYDCYISAGIGGDDSFTRDFFDRYKIYKDNKINEYNSFAIDGSIESYPYYFTKDISFVKKYISSFNDSQHTNFHYLIKKYNNIFLKMDIEGGEYPWLSSLDDEMLSHFSQIVIEFHGIYDDEFGMTFIDKKKCFEKLARTHYLIHAHGNNYAHRNSENMPWVIELTYVNKKIFDRPLSKNTMIFPISGLDYPNNPSNPDYILNFYPFTNL